MNLPNALTVSRLVAIPPLMILLMARFDGHDQIAAGVFVIFSLTDLLDGYLARRRGQVSELGKFLDPLADKLFVLSVLIVLVQEGLVAAWVVVLIFSRELLITVLRSVGASQGRVIAAAPSGKTKTVMQVAAVTLLILQRPYPVVVPVAALMVAIAIVFTLWSGFDYLWRFRHLFFIRDSAKTLSEGGVPGSSIVPLSEQLSTALKAKNLTLAVAESCTGGMLGALITEQPGSSAYFLGGIVAYADHAKADELGVDADVLRTHGAVSEEVARAMADGVRSRFRSDLAASITGIAGPGSDGSSKPVGLTYIAVAGAAGTAVCEFKFQGDRQANRQHAADEALRLLVEAVGK